MTNLVIVESPAKCSKIQGFLGSGWRVIASLGHIRHLKEDLDSVGIDRDFEPTFEFMKEKLKAINQIKDAAKSASTIYLASDDDREGELIAYSVALLLKLPIETTPRAVFHEITSTAVKAAVASPRTLDMNKVNAAQARSMLDMMIGFTISPLLWNAIGPALSAGRCQTPALRIVADREKEISEFQSSSSWKVHGTWYVGASAASATLWPATLTDELEDEESALAYLENHHNEPYGRVLTAETKPWSESPPVPLITSTLQQQASSLFRVAPKRTMQIAQALYEAGHITYMRTDKAVLSEEAVASAKEMVTQQYGAEYVGAGTAKKGKKTKKEDTVGPVTQDAHEAIRPTHFDLIQLPATEDWNAIDRKIYQLIWLKAVQSVMASARGDQRTVTFVADGDAPADFQWRATWRKTTFEGWRKASTKETTTEEDQQETDNEEHQWKTALALQAGTKLTWSTMAADPHETKAPPRYTEASLVRELEQRGIGRPSTFASLISTITDKKYVEQRSFDGRTQEITKYTLTKPNVWPPEESKQQQKIGAEKDRLTPTPLGTSVLAFCVKHFDDLFAYGFTAQMESRLDQIAEGQEVWKQVLRDTWSAYKDRYKALKTAKSTVDPSAPSRQKQFGGGLKAILTKKGPLLLKEYANNKDNTVFYGWPPEHPSIDELTEEQARAFVAKAAQEKEGKVLGEHEGHPVVMKNGKFGTYAMWNGKTTSCQPTDSLESVVEKLQSTASKALRVVGQFEIRNGPYGPYMFKHAVTGPSRKFVSVPATVNIEEVNEAQLIAIFQHELQNKARSGAFGSKGDGGSAPRGGRGGRGGFRGGRGGFRGRGK